MVGGRAMSSDTIFILIGLQILLVVICFSVGQLRSKIDKMNEEIKK